MFNGTTHYEWAIFHGYVKLPEGKMNIYIDIPYIYTHMRLHHFFPHDSNQQTDSPDLYVPPSWHRYSLSSG